MQRRDILICLLLAGITLGIYWPVQHFDLIYYDDPVLLQDSPEVQAGLTWPGIKWALSSIVIANWQPVTNLSFLMVSQFFGTSPGAHHLANVIIHAANAVLLFLLLRRLTRETWPSAVVAAVFAWHPLRVESVAWIIERKDVLCAFFFLLSLIAYVRFAQNKSPAGLWVRPGGFWLALVAFALALLSKPMAVTLPFVLLLLDLWPLQRLTGTLTPAENFTVPPRQPSTINRQLTTLCLEKWPFFAVMVLFCLVTYQVQHNSAAMTSWDQLGADARVANAISSYVAYLGQMFWPLNLAVIYPFPKSYDPALVLLKAALLLLVSLGCLLQITRRPWLAVGWFWYLGTAVPIIGLVQVGDQSMADRYTYLPLIGPVLALVWTVREMFLRVRNAKMILAAIAILLLSTLAALSERQLQFWHNTIALFEHNIIVTPGNAGAYYTLGLGFEHAGDTNRAVVCYRIGKLLEPADKQNRRNLAHLLVAEGHLAAAEYEYNELVAMDPNDYSWHMSLASLFAQENRMDESLFQLNEALRLNPDSVEGLNDLAWELATSPKADVRDGARAVILAQHACELTKYEKPVYIGTLAAAYAEAGKFDDAIATAQRACDLASKNGETGLLQKNQELMRLYLTHQSYHETDGPK